MSTTYFDYYGNPVAQVAAVQTAQQATAAGQTLTAVASLAQLQDTTGGDVLIGGPVSTNFMVSDPATTVSQGTFTGVSTVTAWTNIFLPSGVNDLYMDENASTAVGNAAQNLIVANGSGDLVNGGGGNDVLVDGGAGGDRFEFTPGAGKDVVYGFQTSGATHDFIALGSAYGLNDFSQLASHLSQQGADVLLTLSSTDSVLIRNTQVSALTAQDFLLPVDTSKLSMTFDDEFNSLSLYNPATGTGTYRTNFLSGAQTGPGDWASHALPESKQQSIYVDPSYAGAGSTPLGINPFSISNGVLTITAAQTPTADLSALSGYTYTSGMLSTQPSFAQTYGYFEMKAELPTAQGVWPAFWMIPANASYPAELDVMENVGGNTLYQTAHYGSATSPSLTTFAAAVANLSGGFHTYGLLWTAQNLTWYIDGEAVASMATPADANQPMYMLINLGIGGSWPGNAPSSLTSAQMQVDYVHAYNLTYNATSSTDQPTESWMNAINSAYNYSLVGSPLQTLTLTGTGNLTGTANALGDQITGNTGNDTLIGGAGADVLDASKGGSDLLNAGAGGQDTLIGGAGNDTFIVANGSDMVTALAGHQNVLETTVSFQTPANIQTVMVLNGASVSVWANGTGDTMIAGSGSVIFDGGAGNDSFVSGSGVDTFVAGSGIDTFSIQNAADVIQGVPIGSQDVVQASVSYQAPSNAAELVLTGSANLTGWSNATGATLFGNSGNDTLFGGTGNDTLVAGGGSNVLDASSGGSDLLNASAGGQDTLIGGAGNDTFIVANGADLVTALAGHQNVLQTTVSFHTPDNIQTVTVLSGANVSIWANSTGDKMIASWGNDTFYGGAGNDSFASGSGVDTFVAGTGVDTFFIQNTADVILGVPIGSHDIVQSTVSYRLPANALELVLSGAANVSGWSNATGATLVAGSGNDTLYGGAGNDSFISGSGVDLLVGGAGADTYSVQNSADVILPGTGTSTVWSGVSYHLPDNIQVGGLTGSANLSLWAGAGAVRLYGNAGADALYAGSGIDTLTGGAGNDTFVFGLNSAKDTITDFGQYDVIDLSAYLNAGYAAALTQVGANTVVTLSNGETITLTGVQQSALVATGRGYALPYVASSSTDLPPAASIVAVNSAYSYSLAATSQQTLTLTGTGNLTGTANAFGDHILGNAGNDTLIGGTGADVLDASKGGSDLLNAGAGGQDTLIGGAGNDTFIVANGADLVTALTGHQNVLETTVSFHTPDNIQTVMVLNGANVSLWANGTGDTMVASWGADTFYGGAGNDSFVGGSGVNTFVAGAGVDSFWITNAADVIQGIPTGSRDVVQTTVSYHLPANAAELVLSGSGNISGWSNATGATLIANSGSDVLYGGAGNDSFLSGSGVDTLVGGAGADSYTVNNSADVITPGSGTSTVWSSVSYHLPDNIQVASLTGSANLSLWVGAGPTLAYANSGNDVLYAGSGIDTLAAGAGTDTFVFGLNSAKDTISGLSQNGVHDVIDLSAYLNAGDTTSLSMVGWNSVITVSNGETITLLGVAASSLTQTSTGYMH